MLVFVVLFLSFGMTNIALILFLINRILDGIDGTMARLSKTDLGGYYDIVCDFFIYATLVLFCWIKKIVCQWHFC